MKFAGDVLTMEVINEDYLEYLKRNKLIKCLWCSQHLYVPTNPNNFYQQKFCCNSCRVMYSGKKNNRKSNWSKKNPSKAKEAQKKNYNNNKDKWICRMMTLKLAKTGRILLEKKCKKCNTSIELQIHHEKYSPTVQGILEDVKAGKIYYLCKTCHNFIERK